MLINDNNNDDFSFRFICRTSVILSHKSITCHTSFSSRSEAFAEALASKRASKVFPRQVHEEGGLIRASTARLTFRNSARV